MLGRYLFYPSACLHPRVLLSGPDKGNTPPPPPASMLRRVAWGHAAECSQAMGFFWSAGGDFNFQVADCGEYRGLPRCWRLAPLDASTYLHVATPPVSASLSSARASPMHGSPRLVLADHQA